MPPDLVRRQRAVRWRFGAVLDFQNIPGTAEGDEEIGASTANRGEALDTRTDAAQSVNDLRMVRVETRAETGHKRQRMNTKEALAASVFPPTRLTARASSPPRASRRKLYGAWEAVRSPEGGTGSSLGGFFYRAYGKERDKSSTLFGWYKGKTEQAKHIFLFWRI